jgi:hypothetical protein
VVRDLLKAIQTSKFAFDAIRSGSVGVAGSTGTVLRLGLDTAHDLAERLLAEVLAPVAPLAPKAKDVHYREWDDAGVAVFCPADSGMSRCGLWAHSATKFFAGAAQSNQRSLTRLSESKRGGGAPRPTLLSQRPRNRGEDSDSRTVDQRRPKLQALPYAAASDRPADPRSEGIVRIALKIEMHLPIGRAGGNKPMHCGFKALDVLRVRMVRLSRQPHASVPRDC